MCKVFKVNKSSYYHWIKAGCIVKKVDKKLNKSIEISRLLNVSSSTYGNWKTRNTIPYDEIITLCEENKINMRYILTGNNDEKRKNKL